MFLNKWNNLVKSQPEILGPAALNSISIREFFSRFPDKNTSEKWFERLRWGEDILCPHCDAIPSECPQRRPQPYWCGICRRRFSVRTGTLIEGSNVSFQDWAFVLYLHVVSPINAVQLQGYLGIRQQTTWFMLHRLRCAWPDPEALGAKEAEVDETYFGSGRGTAGKTTVIGMKDRHTKRIAAEVISSLEKAAVQAFIRRHLHSQGRLLSDGFRSYTRFRWVSLHETVEHQDGEYVRGDVHTNGMESFWSGLKRAYYGIYHHFPEKHFQLYLNEVVGRHNLRDRDTTERMKYLGERLVRGGEGGLMGHDSYPLS